MKHIAPEAVSAEAEIGLAFWKENGEMKIKNLTPASYQAAKSAFDTAQTRFKELERQFQDCTTERNILGQELNEMNVRVRAAVKGYFGPDSPEYEKVGGTRSSDRRHPTRRNVPETATAETAAGNGK